MKRHLRGWRKQLPPALQQVQDYRISRHRHRAKRRGGAEVTTNWTATTEYVAELQRLSPELTRGQALVKEFQGLLAGRKEQQFDQWRATVAQSGLKELQSFADALMKDEAAVRAAMTYEWSNGQVEGKVNKLKMIKRTMFGRAGFGLLRARVLQAG